MSTPTLIMLAATAFSAPAVAADGSQQAQEALSCITMNTERLPLDSRRSPLDSLSFTVADSPVKICYGRPSARGRTIFGGLVEYGELWRTGANEPTMIHTSVPLSVAGIQIDEGTYSLYTVPGTDDWEVIVNASISQWGHEGRYSEAVRGREVGRATVRSVPLEEHVEMFTIRAEPAQDGGATVRLEWADTGVLIPIEPAGD